MARVSIVILVCFMCSYGLAARRRFRNEECILDGAKLNYYNISSCQIPSKERCPLFKNENITFIAEFSPYFDVKEVQVNVAGKLVVWIPFQLPKDSWYIEGDLKEGNNVKLILTLHINAAFPTINVDVKIQVTGDGKNLICIIVPAKIVNNNNP